MISTFKIVGGDLCMDVSDPIQLLGRDIMWRLFLFEVILYSIHG